MSECILVLAEDQSVKREEEARTRQEILERFQNAPFEEIVARAEAKVRSYQTLFILHICMYKIRKGGGTCDQFSYLTEKNN